MKIKPTIRFQRPTPSPYSRHSPSFVRFELQPVDSLQVGTSFDIPLQESRIVLEQLALDLIEAIEDAYGEDPIYNYQPKHRKDVVDIDPIEGIRR